MDNKYIVLIENWEDELKYIELVHILKGYGYRLSTAKEVADEVLDKKNTFLCFESKIIAIDTFHKLKNIGCTCQFFEKREV